MFLSTGSMTGALPGFPRVCGDVSAYGRGARRACSLSPRMRGCFWLRTFLGVQPMAFPAYAGMFPDVHSSRTPQGRFPRVCGDVSESYPPLGELVWLSPRMRGCFSVAVVMLWATLAFPAYAGMFLVFGIVLSPCTCFPRVCGDVS